MYFNSLDEIWRMGGHGPFVWAAYSLTALILILLVVVPLQRQRRFFADQIDSERRRVARAQQINPDSKTPELKAPELKVP